MKVSIGSTVLLITSILVFCGFLQRVLDRMKLTDRQALLLIGLMLAGTFAPEIEIGQFSINIGGCLIPGGICIYLLISAESAYERLRSVIGAVIIGFSIYLLSKLLPSEPEMLQLDPLWLYAASGAILAWLIGRSRRAAFICGVAGTLLADLMSYIVSTLQGFESELHLGGGGIVDTCVMTGVLSVLLCETVGELLERLTRERRGET